MTPSEILALLPLLTPEERAEVDKLLASDTALWRPQVGPQSDAIESAADIICFGGSAGGGKSELVCGLALMHHQRSVIFRSEKAQTEGIIQRLGEIIGNSVGYNSQKAIWKLGPGRLVEFGGLEEPGSEKRWQGRPHDLISLDEATEINEARARFVMGWNRTPDPNQRCRVLMTFNPPTTVEGRWIIVYLAPWLDRKHPNPAAPGELRWFASIDGNPDFECEDARRFVWKDGAALHDFDPRDHDPTDIITPKSRTFIPSKVTDNLFYVSTDYISTLQSLPEPLRSQMLKGDFMAGVEDDEWQVIPTAWVEAAMDRWRPKLDAKPGPMDSIGVDVARGGRDATILAPRHGTWFDDLIVKPGASTPDGPTVFAHIMAARRDRAVVHIDIIGVGSSPYDFCVQNGVQAVPINGAAKSVAMSAEGTMRFANLRAQLWWQMREALDPNALDPISLPDDTRLLADLTTPRWRMTTAGILVESKEDMKKRLGRSPDRGDAAVYALVTTPKDLSVGDMLRLQQRGEPDRYAELR